MSEEERQDLPVTPKGRRRLTTTQLAVRVVAKITALVIILVLCLTFVVGVHVHYGNNMFPSVRDGDLVVSFRLQNPFINAVVLYKHEGEIRVGRVIAMEGHTVDITDQGELLVNGIAPAEEVFYPTYRQESSSIAFPLTVGHNQVFILNDFRSDCDDSRTFGTVDTQDLMGPLLITLRRRGF